MMMFVQCQAGGEQKNVSFASRKVALPESIDEWDDFDLGLITTKNKPKRLASPVTKPTITNAAAPVATTTTVNARKKSLFDDDDDDDDIL